MEWLTTVFSYIMEHYALYLVVIMSIFMAIIMFVLNYVKKPIKHFTAKIEDERLRKLANKSIIVLSFVMAIGLWYTLHAIAPDIIKINWVEIVFTGCIPVVAYAALDGVLTENNVKSFIYTIKEVSADGKITLEEANKVMNDLGSILDGKENTVETIGEKGQEIKIDEILFVEAPIKATEEDKSAEAKGLKIVVPNEVKDDFTNLLDSLR